ncbi:MAG: hypothetical protein M3Q29_15140 [Chloroflexota bacterium]|nr:hypothetical protein [Chloroflexota bacterium]
MIKRLTAALAMAAVLALPAGTAFAQGRNATAPNCEQGIATAIAASQNRSAVAVTRLTANAARCAVAVETP